MIERKEILTLKAIMLYIVKEWSGTQKCDVYHIVKAAFFAQQFHLVRFMRPLYKDEIIAMPYGPAPSAVYDTLKAARGDIRYSKQNNIDDLKVIASSISFCNEIFSTSENPDTEYLSPSQIECLDDAIKLVGNMKFEELVTQTHKDEWERAYKTDKIMDMIAIAREGGADEDSISYMKQSFDFDKAIN